MARKIYAFLLMSCLCFSLFIAQSKISYAASNEDLSAEQLVAAHVKSIGRLEYIAKIKSRTFVGTTGVEFIQGMNGELKGTSMFVSQGSSLAIVAKYQDINYPGEYLAYDGKAVSVGYMKPGQRSPLADFIFRFNEVAKEGFLGGTLSGSWPLLDIKKSDPDLKCRKTKVEGKELYELEYRPKNMRSDLKIRMYFDPETFRHVRTEYKVRIRDDASVGNTEVVDQLGEQSAIKSASPNARMQIGSSRADSIYELVEKFGDFKKIGGIVVPHRYELDYSAEGASTFIGHWILNAGKWGFNQVFDEKIFQAQK